MVMHNMCFISTNWTANMLKVPLLWVMKGSYFGLGVPNNRLTCIQGQKTLSFSYNKHLFLLYCSSTPKRFVQRLIFPNPSV